MERQVSKKQRELLMEVQVETNIKKRSAVKFTFSKEMIAFIKSLDKFYYDPDQKFWTFGEIDLIKVLDKDENLGN